MAMDTEDRDLLIRLDANVQMIVVELKQRKDDFSGLETRLRNVESDVKVVKFGAALIAFFVSFLTTLGGMFIRR